MSLETRAMPIVTTGMTKANLKKLLIVARKTPISCALASGDRQSVGQCLIILDKIKPPKVLMATLKKQFPELKTPSFGTATVDVGVDPKLVTFLVNKKVSGMPKRLVKSLKGTGFTKVTIEKGGPSRKDNT
jgi:hypothetical protein